MEKDVEEENKHGKGKLIVTDPDWLDLPEPITTNIILEHLDLDDYFRFSAVCKKWQTIQKEHRIGYSPHPPPSPLPFPWLRSSRYLYNEYGVSIHFYLPNKQKSYSIPFNKTRMTVNASGYTYGRAISYGYGWLVLMLNHDQLPWLLCIFNPITGVQIELPSNGIPTSLSSRPAHISSSPTVPDCTIVIMDYFRNVSLYRPNDNNGLIKTDYSIHSLGEPISCHNKIYYVTHCKKLCIIDALPLDPVKRIIEMDCSEICVDLGSGKFDLVELLEELVMVVAVYDELIGIGYHTIKEFHVYKADLLTNKWVRMQSLGDHALFFSNYSIFLLPAVDVGCKKNTIYSAGGLKGSGVAWRAFDVSTKNWLDGPHMSLLNNDYHSDSKWSWFLPTLEMFPK